MPSKATLKWFPDFPEEAAKQTLLNSNMKQKLTKPVILRFVSSHPKSVILILS